MEIFKKYFFKKDSTCSCKFCGEIEFQCLSRELKSMVDKLERKEKSFLKITNDLNERIVEYNTLIDNQKRFFENKCKKLNNAIEELRELYEKIEDFNLKSIKTGLDVVKAGSRIR